MNHRTSIALALAALALSTTAHGASLSEGDVLKRARDRHMLIAAARLDADAAEGDVQAAEGAFDTTLKLRGTAVPLGGYPQGRADVVVEVPTTLWGSTFFTGYRWGSDGVAPYDGKLVTNELGEVRAGVAVPTWRNGPIDRRRANIERAELGRAATGDAVAQATLDTQRAAGLRYWSWVGATLRRGEVARLHERALQRERDTRERAERGDAAPADVIDAERAVMQRRQLLVSAERALRQAEIELSIYLPDDRGRPVMPSVEQRVDAMPALPPVPPPSALPAAAVASKRPDLARIGRSRDQQEVELRWARNQLAPAIDLTAVVSKDLGDGDVKRDPAELEVGVVIDVPIDTDVASGRARAARAAAARVALSEAMLRAQIDAELRDALNALDAALDRERLAREEARLAEAALAAERDRFDLGESTVFMVDLREQAALEASLRSIDAAIDARRATVVLRAAAVAMP